MLVDGPIDQTNDAGVCLAADDRKLAEIFIERYEDSIFSMGEREDFFIAGILLPIARPDDVMAARSKLVTHGPGNAGIEKQFHEAESVGQGSTRSCATSRRAYMRQA